MKKLRILALMHRDLVPPDNTRGIPEKEKLEWVTEYDVVKGLMSLGHDVNKLGVATDLGRIREAILEYKPHIAFNLLEEFHGDALYDQHVVSYLELMRQPYTGCNPRGLTLSHDKALCKKILSYHRILTPSFAVIPLGRKVKKPKRLNYPILVKSAIEEGSYGISQASVVHNDEKLNERVSFIHESIGSDALIEEYIDGREFYLGMMGNQRVETLPLWELWFTKLPEGSSNIATSKVKWDNDYQKKIGLRTGAARKLPEGVEEKIIKMCKRAYRALGITGYARMDLRLDKDNKIYLIEANPNPQLAKEEDFAYAALKSEINYEGLLNKIITLGMSYGKRWKRKENH